MSKFEELYDKEVIRLQAIEEQFNYNIGPTIGIYKENLILKKLLQAYKDIKINIYLNNRD